MSSFAWQAGVALVALIVTSSSAFAAIDVMGRKATFGWTPSSGPVVRYAVYVARNGAPFTDHVEAWVSKPRATVRGRFGDTIRVRVAAFGRDGGNEVSSPPSLASIAVRFVNPRPRGGGGRQGGTGDPQPSVSGPAAKSTRAPASSPLVSGAAPYDFNGDGRTDLLWRNEVTQEVAVWLMNGTSPSSITEIGALDRAWVFLGSGDFDGDGRADLLLYDRSRREYQIWFMNGGQLLSKVDIEDPGHRWTLDGIGDFDGDGYADLLWRAGKENLIWFMRGANLDGEFEGPRARGVSSTTCTPDLNGDGRSDLVRSHRGDTVAWLMDGSTAGASGDASRSLNARVLGCGDADGDGFGDLLWYQDGTRRGTLWAMDGGLGVALSLELPQLDAGWRIEASGDFDGNGLANDILVRDNSSGTIEFWELRWNSAFSDFSVVTAARAGMGSGDWRVLAP